MFNKDELDQLLANVGSKIEKPVNIFMIGGCALSFKGLKEATKDIDIIITDQEGFNILNMAMKENGFQSMTEKENEFYLTALAVYKKDDSRIDVFLKQVGKMLFLTKNMITRSEEYRKYDKLSVYLVSNEDIFLFKMMTSREGDIYDCDRIMRNGIDYKIIYEEVIEQSKEKGKRWFFWVYENMCKLEDYNGIRVSIKNKIFELVKKYWNERPNDFMSGAPDKAKHIPDKRLLKDLISQ
ncbi:MAG: DUF6036 family nucleotidyltransferase [Nanoarchaeota archaeon]